MVQHADVETVELVRYEDGSKGIANGGHYVDMRLNDFREYFSYLRKVGGPGAHGPQRAALKNGVNIPRQVRLPARQTCLVCSLYARQPMFPESSQAVAADCPVPEILASLHRSGHLRVRDMMGRKAVRFFISSKGFHSRCHFDRFGYSFFTVQVSPRPLSPAHEARRRTRVRGRVPDAKALTCCGRFVVQRPGTCTSRMPFRSNARRPLTTLPSRTSRAGRCSASTGQWSQTLAPETCCTCPRSRTTRSSTRPNGMSTWILPVCPTRCTGAGALPVPASTDVEAGCEFSAQPSLTLEAMACRPARAACLACRILARCLTEAIAPQVWAERNKGLPLAMQDVGGMLGGRILLCFGLPQLLGEQRAVRRLRSLLFEGAFAVGAALLPHSVDLGALVSGGIAAAGKAC